MNIPFNFFRFTLVWILFVWLNPELLSVSEWQMYPAQNMIQIGEVFLIALALEVLYRAFAWREKEELRDWVVVPAPKLCCNKWVCLVEELPPIGELFEAYCISGVTMLAFITVNKGVLELTLQSESGELERYDPNALRPTYWRHFQLNCPKEVF